eukprot:tig00000057_g72.t1
MANVSCELAPGNISVPINSTESHVFNRFTPKTYAVVPIRLDAGTQYICRATQFANDAASISPALITFTTANVSAPVIRYPRDPSSPVPVSSDGAVNFALSVEGGATAANVSCWTAAGETIYGSGELDHAQYSEFASVKLLLKPATQYNCSATQTVVGTESPASSIVSFTTAAISAGSSLTAPSITYPQDFDTPVSRDSVNKVSFRLMTGQNLLLFVTDDSGNRRQASRVSVVVNGSQIVVTFEPPSISRRMQYRQLLFSPETPYNLRFEPEGFAPFLLTNITAKCPNLLFQGMRIRNLEHPAVPVHLVHLFEREIADKAGAVLRTGPDGGAAGGGAARRTGRRRGGRLRGSPDGARRGAAGGSAARRAGRVRGGRRGGRRCGSSGGAEARRAAARFSRRGPTGARRAAVRLVGRGGGAAGGGVVRWTGPGGCAAGARRATARLAARCAAGARRAAARLVGRGGGSAGSGAAPARRTGTRAAEAGPAGARQAAARLVGRGGGAAGGGVARWTGPGGCAAGARRATARLAARCAAGARRAAARLAGRGAAGARRAAARRAAVRLVGRGGGAAGGGAALRARRVRGGRRRGSPDGPDGGAAGGGAVYRTGGGSAGSGAAPARRTGTGAAEACPAGARRAVARLAG